MRINKWLQQDRVVQFITYCASLYMRFVFRTTRWQHQGFEIPQRYVENNRGFVVCFWHSRLFLAVFGWTFPTPFSMIISSHKDGRLIAETVKHFGIRWITGSSTRGGAQALRQAVRCLKKGEAVGVTPDGPRGPRHHAQPGPVVMAQLANVDILPFSYDISRCIVLNTWDRLVIPLPFGRGILTWSSPLEVTGKEIPVAQKDLETVLGNLEGLLEKGKAST